MTYKVKNETSQFDIEQEKLDQVDLIHTGGCQFNVIHGLKSSEGELVDICLNSKTVEIILNNKSYSFQISDSLDQLIEKLGFDKSLENVVKEIKAPMPGLILDINVSEGQSFQQGDQLLVLEAMKMENVIKAESDGIVKKVHLSQGDTVEKNKVIIELE